MKNKDVSSLEHTSWRCQYHIVFAPKYRRMEIYGQIKQDTGVPLCDDTRTLQIHHAIKRSLEGSNSPYNLICLCSNCHALAHGTNLQGWVDVTQEDIEQAIIEYLADYYPGYWNPWRKDEGPQKEETTC